MAKSTRRREEAGSAREDKRPERTAFGTSTRGLPSIIILLAAVLALALPGRAWGHAGPERFSPAPGAVLAQAPEQIDGWFTQDVRRQQGASYIEVFDAAGTRVDDGSPVVDDADRRHMYVRMKPGQGEGRFLVAWQTLSDEDDELDGGCFWFYVGQAAADSGHTERLRVDAADACPVDIADATQLFGKAASASITIDVPLEVESGDVTVGLSTDGATIRAPLGDGRDPLFAHYHLYLDMAPVLHHSHNGEGMDDGEQMGSPLPDYSQDVMVIGDSFTFRDLPPGTHIVAAALFYDDHSPFQPPVMQSAAFRVLGGDGGISTGTAIAIAVGVGVAAAAGGAAAAAMLARRRPQREET